MKTPHTSNSLWLLLITAFLFSGCASTTLLTTAPPGAKVYVNGEVMGTTPYRYSDTKPALSSTRITFTKQGFRDLDIILKRNERPAWGAIIGATMVYVPILWFAQYNKSHFYELEPTALQGRSEDYYADRDTLIKSETEISVADEIPDSGVQAMTDTNSYNTLEASGKDFTKRRISEFGIGSGMCLKGGLFGMDYTYIGPESWGVNIPWNMNISLTPMKYNDYDRPSPPMDYLNVFSFNVIKAFGVPEKDRRIRFEAGPSAVFFSKATIVTNPDYDPNHVDDSWFWSFGWMNNKWRYKYNKERSSSSTIGVSMTAKMEFLLSPSFDLEVSLFANLNSLKSICGLGLFMNFGDVKD
jgi:hypothetical protein